MNDFLTEKVEVEFIGYEKKENEHLTDLKANVFWNYELELRQWGIKDIYKMVVKILITWTVEDWGTESEKDHELEIVHNFDGWVIDTDTLGNDCHLICPSFVSVDFKNKKVKVDF